LSRPRAFLLGAALLVLLLALTPLIPRGDDGDGLRPTGRQQSWALPTRPARARSRRRCAPRSTASRDLGPGTTGSLVWCGGAAYFVRDPQTDTDPARLMRFSPDGPLTVVYESASQGNAFLSVPRCGGDAITLTSYGDQGDEQVTADLG
jgi:hypothetical protein